MAGKLAGNSGNAGKLRYESPRRGPPPPNRSAGHFFSHMLLSAKSMLFSKKISRPNFINFDVLFFYNVSDDIAAYMAKICAPTSFVGGMVRGVHFHQTQRANNNVFFLKPPKNLENNNNNNFSQKGNFVEKISL